MTQGSVRSLEGRVAFITGAARGQGRAHAGQDGARGGQRSSRSTYARRLAFGQFLRRSNFRGLCRGRYVLVEAEGREDPRAARSMSVTAQRSPRWSRTASNSFGTSRHRGRQRRGLQLESILGNVGRAVGNADRHQPDRSLGKPSRPRCRRSSRVGAVDRSSWSVRWPGLKALPGQAHYASAKFGLVGLTQAAAKELGEYKIRVNSIHPYGVNTPMGVDQGALEVFAKVSAVPSQLHSDPLGHRVRRTRRDRRYRSVARG